MFSFGLNELLIIIFVAVLIIAPKDIPRVMKTLGKFLARTRMFTRNVNDYFNDFVDKALLSEEIEDDEDNNDEKKS